MSLDSYTDRDSYMKGIDILDNGVGAEREEKLSKIIKHSNNLEAKQKAIEELVNGNLGLVLKCAGDIFEGYHSNLSYMDLVTEGNFALFRCASRFSYKKETRFSTYAYPIIRWRIWNLINTNSLIHIPYNIIEQRKKFKNLKDKYKKDLTKDIIMKELDVLSMAAENIKDAYDISVTSLDSNIGDESDITLKDIIEDEQSVDPSKEADKNILKEYLDKIGTECLTKREKEVVNEMFYSSGNITYESVAAKIGVSRERTRQIYERAIRKLKYKFFSDWDIDHAEDRIDKEAIYKESTGNLGYCNNYRMRLQNDNRFHEKLSQKMKEKGRKILEDLS